MEKPETPLKSRTSVTHPYIHARGARSVRPYVRPLTAALTKSWSVPDLCAAYNWPTKLGGGGVIAIIELGGGWYADDMNRFFKDLDEASVPTIIDVSVDGTENTRSSTRNDADDEVALDIQVAGAAYFAATGHAAVIRVYWAQDIASAVRKATEDGCDVCSISWGSDESNWRENNCAAANDLEQAVTEATARGMVVFAASGDNDSSDGGPNPANVDLPASAPHVIGCGGTTKTATTETVWNGSPGNAFGNGTGGGFSTIFPMPSWQAGAPHGPGRMVPDVAADADPSTGYQIFVHGAQAVVGGTSAVAPLYAGLFAAFGKHLGFITPTLWLNHTCFNDIRDGDNGAFRARVGPDACTGIGSPIGEKLAELFSGSQITASRQLNALELENQQLRVLVSAILDGQASSAHSNPAWMQVVPPPASMRSTNTTDLCDCLVTVDGKTVGCYPGISTAACNLVSDTNPNAVGTPFPLGSCRNRSNGV